MLAVVQTVPLVLMILYVLNVTLTSSSKLMAHVLTHAQMDHHHSPMLLELQDVENVIQDVPHVQTQQTLTSV